MKVRVTAAIAMVLVMSSGARAHEVDIGVLFAKAEAEGRVGVAKKQKTVDARPAKPGEIVVTVIKGEGKETESKPASPGDMVVRNRCEATGNEQQLVKAATFAERYDGPLSGDEQSADAAEGWKAYRPRGVAMKYFIVNEAEGSFVFIAPWGEPMVAKPGDAIVRDPANSADTYRIARAAFSCTYEIVLPPQAD